MITPNREILAYVAGLYDGEGTLVYSGHNGKRLKQRLELRVTNTFKPVVDFCQTSFGVGTVRQRKVARVNHKQAYIWIARGLQAEQIFRALLPFLIIKRNHIEHVLRIREMLQ